MLRYLVLISFLMSLTGASFAGSVPPADSVVSLRNALETALEANPEIRAFGRAVSAQKEDVGIARSFVLPQLKFEERFMRTNNPTYAFMAKLNQGRFSQDDFAIPSLNSPAAINDFQTSVSFEQAVFAPKAYIGIDMAEKELAAKGDEYDRKREEVALRVFGAYMGVQTAKAFVHVAEQAMEEAREHERIAEKRCHAGLGLYSDTLRAQVASSSAEEKLVSAQKVYRVSKRALGLMLGLTASLDVESDRPALGAKDIDYYLEAAKSRKDLRSLEVKYQNAENSLRMATAGYLPVLGLGGAYQLNDHSSPLGTEGDSWQLVAFLRWDIFDGLKREHERSKARHQIARTGEYLDGLRKEISFKVYDAYLGVDEAKKRLELAKKSLKAAEEGRRLVQVRYENSLSAIVDLLDVQTQLDSVRAEVANREGEYLTAIADLAFQGGTLLKDLGLEK